MTFPAGVSPVAAENFSSVLAALQVFRPTPSSDLHGAPAIMKSALEAFADQLPTAPTVSDLQLVGIRDSMVKMVEQIAPIRQLHERISATGFAFAEAFHAELPGTAASRLVSPETLSRVNAALENARQRSAGESVDDEISELDRALVAYCMQIWSVFQEAARLAVKASGRANAAYDVMRGWFLIVLFIGAAFVLVKVGPIECVEDIWSFISR